MNCLQGRITQITSSGTITLVDIDTAGTRMISVIIDRPESVTYLSPAEDVEIVFNESELSLGRINDGMISLNNQFPCVVQGIVSGKILSRVILDFQGNPLTSLITTRSVARLNLQKGHSVIAFVKSTEVILKNLTASPGTQTEKGNSRC